MTTIEVNLYGALYSQCQNLLHCISLIIEIPVFLAAHLGVNYLQQNQKEGDLKSLVFIGSVGMHNLSFSTPYFLELTFLPSVVDGHTCGRNVLGLEARNLGRHESVASYLRIEGYQSDLHPPLLRWCAISWFLSSFYADTYVVRYCHRPYTRQANFGWDSTYACTSRSGCHPIRCD